MPRKTKKHPAYIYPIEVLRKFRDSSAEWKLNWLEEINILSSKVLNKREKVFREKIRKGLIKT
ncbi:MAG: hypothetical protein A3C43_05340 [Candidatus Schekmanbacteria bacterium RIFCSPHIGHO2_02_FULL_38_11]|uniref:Uncharacterized protein n=1 Tax=Candidatus Schekmanbacteria bacterium RIFCSPLOWO2_12_FULL_38_15 TaxID=1817883 RepID=A0A1F7SDS6_9BACT|nr:MAG: hypothetical protein A2043_03195 [Candidatus Schekmanbacteria bacterium GWA2_38_9]OGL51408.1 MAG: hypothetical protein A3G31_06025 [Candidatus Schekmanbacteria bacterium RIFCSPLOWO2_12_FULL_38_15]OGL51585.1 MAG: hypothetical protein A3H37_09540 [Candidatus Schekmanbacteria bacterium RIFCSPLOWO2_02_FULL_38_14]OGL53208.1 MAG: hypothetical protein A3C43_05340 [Candidatus Schekmanbacteria bacterium RIFCSPHIGHO2_02_FULL_38_11]